MSDETINVDFSFGELAGLYYILNMGFLSIVTMNTEEDTPTYKEALNEWRAKYLDVREAGNFNELVQKTDDIREILLQKVKANEVDSTSE